MNMQQCGIDELLELLDIKIEKSFPILPNYLVAVKVKEIEDLIDRIASALPYEVQEAKAFLRRKEELQMEAQKKAEKIILDAQNEASRLLSESDVLKAVENEAENIRIQATEEAMKIREGAEVYAEQVLNNLDKDLAQLQQVVKNGQIYMEKLRSESGKSNTYDSLASNYAPTLQGKGENENFDIE